MDRAVIWAIMCVMLVGIFAAAATDIVDKIYAPEPCGKIIKQ